MRLSIFAVLAFGAAALLPAMAQQNQGTATDAKPAQGGMMHGGMMQGGMMQGGMMQGGMMGMHVTPVTVTALDAKTGLVDATSGGMTLKLHFPPESLANVKAGDKLSVHMGFRKL